MSKPDPPDFCVDASSTGRRTENTTAAEYDPHLRSRGHEGNRQLGSHDGRLLPGGLWGDMLPRLGSRPKL